MVLSTAATNIKERGKKSGRFIPSSSGLGAGGGKTIAQIVTEGAKDIAAQDISPAPKTTPKPEPKPEQIIPEISQKAKEEPKTLAGQYAAKLQGRIAANQFQTERLGRIQATYEKIEAKRNPEQPRSIIVNPINPEKFIAVSLGDRTIVDIGRIGMLTTKTTDAGSYRTQPIAPDDKTSPLALTSQTDDDIFRDIRPETYEKRVGYFMEQREKFYSMPLFKITKQASETAGLYSTLPIALAFGDFNKPPEKRNWLTRFVTSSAEIRLNLYPSLAYETLTAPRKIALIAEGTRYQNIKPLDIVTKQTPYSMAFKELGKSLNPLTPEGAASLVFIGEAGYKGGKALGDAFAPTKLEYKDTTPRSILQTKRNTKIYRADTNINELKINTGEYTAKGRATPETYLTILGKQGEINVENVFNRIGGNNIRGFGSYSKEANTIRIKRGTVTPQIEYIGVETPANIKITIAHELIHWKVRESPTNIVLPGYETSNLMYRLSPVEYPTFAFQNVMAKRGFKVTAEQKALLDIPVMLRKGEGFRKTYYREFGATEIVSKQRPLITTQQGTLTKGSITYNLNIKNIGRKSYGYLFDAKSPSTKPSFYFTKTAKGNLKIVTLKPEIYGNYLTRNFMDYFSSRFGAKADTNIVESIKYQSYKAERIKFPKITQRSVTRKNEIRPMSKEDGILYSPELTTIISKTTFAKAKQVKYVNFKRISQSYTGIAKVNLIQKDTATLGKIRIKRGPDIMEQKLYPYLELAAQPTQKANQRLLTTSWQGKGQPLLLLEKYRQQPDIYTNSLQTIEKIGYYRGESRFGIKLNWGKQGTARILNNRAIAKTEKIFTQQPAVEKTNFNKPIITIDALDDAGVTSRIGRAYTGGITGNIIKPLSLGKINNRIEEQTKPISQIRPEIRTAPTTRTRNITQIRPKARNLIREISRVNIQARSRELTQATSKAVTTTPRTPTPALPPITITPPQEIPIKFPKFSNVFISKNKKDKLVTFKPKYSASVEASIFNIRGKPSKWATITGLGLRPIRR